MTPDLRNSSMSGRRLTVVLLACLPFIPTLAPAEENAAAGFTVVHSFAGPDGAKPASALIQDAAGNFQGTTPFGGPGGSGTAYSMSPAGTVTTLQAFPSADLSSGTQPGSGLIRASDNNLYGVNKFGGIPNLGATGTLFRITPDNEFSVLYTFPTLNPIAGTVPVGLVQGRDGRLYGTTSQGGHFGAGTVYAISLSGDFELLHAFGEVKGDGAAPQAALIVGSDGSLVGTTAAGGAHGAGTVFRMTPAGVVTILHSFDSATEGSFPATPLLQVGKYLYGTCRFAGLNGLGWGTVFRLGASGKLTVMHTFRQDGLDGRAPASGLTRVGSDLFGVTSAGGSLDAGTVYRMTPAGNVTIVLSFGSAVTDPKAPAAGLLLARDGSLYGTTTRGGANDLGAVYRLSR